MKNIIIYEDNNSLRSSLELLLQTNQQYKVIAVFNDANTIEQDIASYKPDLVILDIDMPGRKGTEVVPIIKRINKDTKILMHTVFDESDKLFDCLCAGANGYVLKKIFSRKVFAICFRCIRWWHRFFAHHCTKSVDEFPES